MKCRCEEIDHAKTYHALKSMIGRIAKDVADAKGESHARLGAFHQIMERIEGKLDAVLELVKPGIKYTEGKHSGLWNPITMHNGGWRLDQDENGKPVGEADYSGWPQYQAERELNRMGSEGKGAPIYTPRRERYSLTGEVAKAIDDMLTFGTGAIKDGRCVDPREAFASQPVTDESGVSVGAGAGPLINTEPEDQHSEFINAIEAIKAGERFSIYRSAGLSEEEFNFLHKRLVYRGWTILENIADMKWEMIPPYRAT